MQLVQDESGVMLDYKIQVGNPSDKMEPVPMVTRFEDEFHHVPIDLAAAKGYYSADNTIKRRVMGVRRIGIPKIGRLLLIEKRRQHKRWFKMLYRFRCGIAAGISVLKRQFLLNRVCVRGNKGTSVWAGFAIFSDNLWQMA
jgi:hypothetical protein